MRSNETILQDRDRGEGANLRSDWGLVVAWRVNNLKDRDSILRGDDENVQRKEAGSNGGFHREDECSCCCCWQLGSQLGLI